MNHKTTLHFLLVLTFITAGLNIISYTGTALLLPQMRQMVDQNPNLIPEAARTYMDMFLSLPRFFFVGSALLYILELTGGILMWQLKASGFHCYTLSRLLLLLVPVLFIGRGFLQLGDVMFAALFILAYWLVLKQLGVLGRNADTNTPDDITPNTNTTVQDDDIPTLPSTED